MNKLRTPFDNRHAFRDDSGPCGSVKHSLAMAVPEPCDPIAKAYGLDAATRRLQKETGLEDLPHAVNSSLTPR